MNDYAILSKEQVSNIGGLPFLDNEDEPITDVADLAVSHEVLRGKMEYYQRVYRELVERHRTELAGATDTILNLRQRVRTLTELLDAWWADPDNPPSAPPWGGTEPIDPDTVLGRPSEWRSKAGGTDTP